MIVNNWSFQAFDSIGMCWLMMPVDAYAVVSQKRYETNTSEMKTFLNTEMKVCERYDAIKNEKNCACMAMGVLVMNSGAMGQRVTGAMGQRVTGACMATKMTECNCMPTLYSVRYKER